MGEDLGPDRDVEAHRRFSARDDKEAADQQSPQTQDEREKKPEEPDVEGHRFY